MPGPDLPAHPGFIHADGRRLFVLHYRPAAEPVARVLVVPALAEEMNKTRRLVALSAAALSASGYEVLLTDLYGTGDSAGEFGEAELDCWRADLAHAARARMQGADIVLSLRGGSLLVDGVLEQLGALSACVVALQPVLRGENYLQQLMRVRLMADRLAGGSESAEELRAAWARGEAVELSGYEFSAALADAMVQSRTRLTAAKAVRVIECRGGDKQEPSTAMARFVDGLGEAAVDAACEVVTAEQFWASQEVSAPASVVAAMVSAVIGIQAGA